MNNLYYNCETERINRILKNNAIVSEIGFLKKEIEDFLLSKKYQTFKIAKNYLEGKQDILKRQRTIIGKNGDLEVVTNLPNNRIVDNIYSKMVEQKNNYLLSKKIVFESDNKDYVKFIENILNNRFLVTIKNIGEDAINYGIAWLYPYFNNGKLTFKRFNPCNIIPFWADEEHTELDMVVRLNRIISYTTVNKKEILTKVEVYKKDRMQIYDYTNNNLVFKCEEYYLNDNGEPLSLDIVPVIPFKSNHKEISLIQKTKTLQDALNAMRSDFMNNMQEDSRNTILILKNYDGTNLGEFRKNLSEYGVVKVKTVDGNGGGVESLQVEVNSNNYQIIIDMLKKAIIDNARGYDSKDERMNNNPNRLNIQSMYSDIDLDANAMELEFKASFENLFYVINNYLKLSGKDSFFNEKINVVFNKDQLINESEVIENCAKSEGILSKETIIANHPWTDNLKEELKKIEEENEDYIKKVDKIKEGANIEEQ